MCEPSIANSNLVDWTSLESSNVQNLVRPGPMNSSNVRADILRAESLLAVSAEDAPASKLDDRKRWAGIDDEVLDAEIRRWAQAFGSEIATLSKFRHLLEDSTPDSISEINLERARSAALFVVQRLYDRFENVARLSGTKA